MLLSACDPKIDRGSKRFSFKQTVDRPVSMKISSLWALFGFVSEVVGMFALEWKFTLLSGISCVEIYLLKTKSNN
jgi:hypothetical protein